MRATWARMWIMAVLFAPLGGCGGCGAGASATVPSSGITPTGSFRVAGCEPLDLANVGAHWTYPGVTCPYAPDPVAIAACQGGGFGAMIGEVGYQTLPEAVAAAQPGQTVVVCPGVHPAVFAARDIDLVAADPTAGATNLDGPRPDYWIDVANVLLRGLSIGPDRGIRVETTSDADLECITVTDHTSNQRAVVQGGYDPGAVTVRHSTFTRAKAAVFEVGALTVEDSAFMENNPDGANTYHVVIDAKSVTLRRTAFFDNVQSHDEGTCISVFSSTQSSLIEDCWFEGNRNLALDYGSIVDVAAPELTVRNTTFVNNSTAAGVSCIKRGRLNGQLTISDSSFLGNTSAEASDLKGSGVLTSGFGSTRVERSRFEDNRVVVEPGASVFDIEENYAWTGQDLVVQRNEGGIGAMALDFGQGVVDCVCCDFGSGPDDNSPVDVDVNGFPVDEVPLNFTL